MQHLVAVWNSSHKDTLMHAQRLLSLLKLKSLFLLFGDKTKNNDNKLCSKTFK